jgi:hypothetical protein
MALRFGSIKLKDIRAQVRSQRELGMGKSISAHKNADEVLFIIMVDRCHLVCNPRDTPQLHPSREHLPSRNTDRVTTLPVCLFVCLSVNLSVCPSVASKTLQEFIYFLIIPSTGREWDSNKPHLHLPWYHECTKYNCRTSNGACGLLTCGAWRLKQ